MSHRKIVNIIFVVLILFAVFFSLAEAQLRQLDYPDLPGAPAPRTAPAREALLDFFRYLYQITLGVGVMIAFGYFVYGGLSFLTSFGKPARVSHAKGLMLSALLGLFILFASYTILSTLNPTLVLFNLQPISVPSLAPAPLPPSAQEQDCQVIPFQASLELIHNLEKEALATGDRIEPLIPEVKDRAKAVKEAVEQCECSGFVSECLIPKAGSALCPSRCPETAGDPCPPVLKANLIPALEDELTRAADIIALLEGYGFTLTDEMKESIEDILDEAFPQEAAFFAEFFNLFITFLENDLGLGPLSANAQLRNTRKEQIGRLLEESFTVQFNLLKVIGVKLSEQRKVFEEQLAQASQCRTEAMAGARQLFVCAEAKDRKIIGQCWPLDFYCCP